MLLLPVGNAEIVPWLLNDADGVAVAEEVNVAPPVETNAAENVADNVNVCAAGQVFAVANRERAAIPALLFAIGPVIIF